MERMLVTSERYASASSITRRVIASGEDFVKRRVRDNLASSSRAFPEPVHHWQKSCQRWRGDREGEQADLSEHLAVHANLYRCSGNCAGSMRA